MPIVIPNQIIVQPPNPTDPQPPQPPQPVPPLAEASFLVTLTGGDGRTWDLNNGPVVLLAGVQQLLGGTAPITHWWKQAPMVDGARRSGMRTERQDLPLPVKTVGASWQAWRSIDSDFFESISPDNGELVITIIAPDRQSRSLRAWYVDNGDVEDVLDPLMRRRKSYVLELSAEPFWEGAVVRPLPFKVGAEAPFFPGPPFHIAESTSTQKATVTNPGNLPVWPRYTITGPATSWTVGIGTSVISSIVPLGSGDKVLIDSEPGQRTILNQAGDRVFKNMTDADFAPIPPGVNVPLVATINGYSTASSVAVEFTPLYRRPW
jgi:hypothetical protein